MYPASMRVFGEMNQDGKSVELTATATDIMWRNVGDTVWNELCPKSDLKGDPGPTPNITPGTITTLAAGSPATASITGTTPNLVLNLGLPSGAAGANATTTAVATTSTNGLMSSTDKTKLDAINSPSSSSVASGGRAIGVGFTVHATRNAWACYSLNYTLSATLALGQAVQVVATVDGSEVARLNDGILLGLAGSLNRTESMAFFVPAGKQVLFTKTGASGVTVTVISGQETLL